MKERPPPLDSICPCCGAPITTKQADLIEVDMKTPQNTCLKCAMSFAEVRASFDRDWDP